MNGMLFTDECEGLPEERTAAKIRMKSFNESSPENSVAAGNPCRVIRRIDEQDRQYYFKGKRIDEALSFIKRKAVQTPLLIKAHIF